MTRIISIVDAYNLMIHKRPYSNPMSKEEALKEIYKCKGTQFDSELAKDFINMILEVEVNNIDV